MEFEPRIYWCADDFGLTAASCDRILQCNKDGFLGRISVFPNSDVADLRGKIRNAGNANFGVHINLVEGKCVSDKRSLSLLVDGDGYFKKTYTGLLALSLSPKRKLFKKQLKTEIKAQIEKTISVFPDTAIADTDKKTQTASSMRNTVFFMLFPPCNRIVILHNTERFPGCFIMQ